MNGYGAINFAPAAKQTAKGKLDLRGIAVSLRHAREDLGCVVEAVVDQMVEADVVVTGKSDGSCSAMAAP
jgi:hypothetical protein